ITAGAQVSFTLTVTPTTVEKVTSQTSGTITNTANTTSDFFNPSPTDGLTRLTTTVTLTPSQAFVAQVYLDLLHRPADGGGLSDGGWLRAVYQDVLGRDLDDNGAKTWLPMLVNPPPGVSADAERLAVALAILHSPESDAHQVQALFGQFLHRAADPGGLAT